MYIPDYGVSIIIFAFLWLLLMRGESKDEELHKKVDDLENRIAYLEKR
jgi:hypothetical protein